ncbi:MAG: 50S ribosomal protein L25 [Acidimicrobiales bacterium]|jgi:large subunit ribosomal protein L25
MADITLLAEADRPTGSRPTRRLRAAGRIPGVVYGGGVDPLPVSVSGRDLREALSTDAGLNALLSLRVGGQSFVAMARELQHHPVRGTVIHVDFQVVDRDRPITAEIPVSLVGEPVELHRADGLLDQQLFSLTVSAKPADLPHQIEVDVSTLGVGDSLRVGDIPLPAGVTAEAEPDVLVAIGQPPRVVREGEGEAGGEASESLGGAAGAAGASSGEGH